MGKGKPIKSLADLTPDRANANKGTERGRSLLEQSLAECGAGRSIVADKDGEVIAGNKALEAAVKLGLPVRVVPTDGSELVVVQRTDLDLDEGGKARRLAYLDNRAGELGLEWDAQRIAADIAAGLQLGDIFSKDELRGLKGWPEALREDPGPQLDKAAELQAKWQVQPGDLWICGAHRVVCGDCTEAAVVAKVMQGEKAALSFTSPPYWVGKEYEKQKSVEEIERFIGQCAKMLAFFTREDESRIVINTSTGFTTSFDKRKKRQTLLLIDKWTNSFWDLGWNLRHVRHWLKEGQLASISAKADMIDQHCEWFLAYEDDVGQEMVFEDRIDQDEVDALLTYYNARGRGQELLGEYRNAKHWALRSYWDDIRGTANQDGHVAVMPLEVAERHLVIYTQREEIVLDPFLGSGTTMVAAQRLGRVCRGIEIEPSYVAVTLERMKGLGLDPVLVKEPAS